MKELSRSHRVSIWIARATIVGALSVIVGLLVAQRQGSFGLVDVALVSDTTIYTRGLSWLWMAVPLCALMVALAVVLWLHPVRWFRIGSCGFLLFAAYLVFLTINTNRDHRVVVSNDHFLRRVGYSFSSEQQTVHFDSLAYMVITRQRPFRNRRPRFNLECHTPSGDVTNVPIHGLMKMALPEIIARAAAHDVLIGDTQTGEKIPPELQ
jgi:hypothetical protein